MRPAEWVELAQRYNATRSRRCPRRPPCADTETAVYEYVTGKEGRAIVLRCLNCGALEHVEMGIGEAAIFQPPWTHGQTIPKPHRVGFRRLSG